jgi:hypothetical protein
MDEMTEREFLAANFFTPDNEMPKAPPELTIREEIAALRRFAKAMERMSPSGRHAAVRWLADKYLGVKLQPLMCGLR